MLGWEFPPHISGGLGTACHGIAKGLTENDVEVLFVVPKSFGDEHTEDVELLSASEVQVTKKRQRLVRKRVEPFGSAPSFDASSKKSTLDWHELDSPLRPYMTEYEYVEKLARVRQSEERSQREQAARAPWETDSSTAVVVEESLFSEPRVELEGGYGPNLIAEVERYAEVVRDLAAREDCDVIHAHDWMTFPAGIAAAEASGKPLVIHFHASEFDRSGRDANAGIRTVEQLGLDRADRVVCVSEYNADVLRENYRVDDTKITVVHNAITSREQKDLLRVEKSIDDPIVLFLGRITYQKGPDYFLEAAARVLKVLPDTRFVVSGSGDMWSRMVERAAQLGISANTHFTGFLEGADVERIFAMADLYVMPSVSEPFGISTLEAMALDVPTIISRQSGVSEVLTNALKVDFWDVEDLANKILALLMYPALTDELAVSGREEVERMSWGERGKSLRHIYEEISS